MEIAPIKAADVPIEQLAGNSKISDRDKVAEVSRQFEAVLLRQILQETRKSVRHGHLVGGRLHLGHLRRHDQQPTGRQHQPLRLVGVGEKFASPIGPPGFAQRRPENARRHSAPATAPLQPSSAHHK
jgi:hypothetical protein